MPRYPQGATVRVTVGPFRDATGALADASPLTLTVNKPDGTSQAYSALAHDSTGLYHQDLPDTDLTVLGAYQWYAVGTVGSFKAVLPSGKFDVFAPDEVTVLSLADAKDTLDIPQATTKYDDEIARKIATIEASLERMTGGPIVNRSITERVQLTSGYTTFVLRKRPVVSVTSITNVASGATVSTSDLDIDTNSGVIHRKLGWVFVGPYFQSIPAFTVVYIAGQGVVTPAAFSEAASVILQHLWESQRGQSSVPQYGGEETVTLPGLGYAIPNRAAELLAPYAQEAYV